MNFTRYIDKEHQPTEDEILNNLGSVTAWKNLKHYLNKRYDIVPELVFYGKNYGWTYRYRKSGRTLCSLYPEYGAFSVLIVLGKKEVEKTLSVIDSFSPTVRTIIQNTEQLHDGRWLWIRPDSQAEFDDIIMLLNMKRKPIQIEL